MSQLEMKRVHVRNIKIDMVLAADVLTENGVMLLAKDTMINNVNYTKLRDSDINYVYIKQSTQTSNAPKIVYEQNTKEKQKTPVTDKPEFKAFAASYEDRKEDYSKIVQTISGGQNADIGELYQVTDSIMSTMNCKSDVFSFLSFIKDSDEHTFSHCINVSLLCNLFGMWLGLNDKELINLTLSGLLHDIGKTKIPNQILNKKGKLSDKEFLIMKQHATMGYYILQNQNLAEDIKLSALMHHEKMDGSGYPIGVKGDSINKFARIVAICDIYDAMTANRIYRGKRSPFDVIRTFEQGSYGELDTEFLLVFLRNIAYNYIGGWVMLSDKREAEVVFINQQNLSRPVVRIDTGEVIDLVSSKSIEIIEFL